jgi:hypothetical protein
MSQYTSQYDNNIIKKGKQCPSNDQTIPVSRTHHCYCRVEPVAINNLINRVGPNQIYTSKQVMGWIIVA